jgi:ACS family hexuronate transporter-like MFS transporter
MDQRGLRVDRHRVPRRVRRRSDVLGSAARSVGHAGRPDAHGHLLLDHRHADVAGHRAAQLCGVPVALFDSGSSIGAAIAPALVLAIFHFSGSWRPAFIVTGALGFVWAGVFYATYRRAPADSASSAHASGRTSLPYRTILRLPQTWGIVLGKALTDPVWFFITDWFAIYLVSRGFRLEDSLLAFWVPFLAADLGNFCGGGGSSALIARGWRVGSARKLVIAVSAAGMTFLVPAAYATSLAGLTSCLAIATFAYAALSTMILNLPADIYPSDSVASVSGLSGTGAGVGTVLATYLTGIVADRYSFRPVLIVASAIPIVAAAAIFILVKNEAPAGRHSRQY